MVHQWAVGGLWSLIDVVRVEVCSVSQLLSLHHDAFLRKGGIWKWKLSQNFFQVLYSLMSFFQLACLLGIVLLHLEFRLFIGSQFSEGFLQGKIWLARAGISNTSRFCPLCMECDESLAYLFIFSWYILCS